MNTPRLILHGGAGRAMTDPTRFAPILTALHTIRAAIWAELAAGASAEQAVVFGCTLLEDEPLFNAGTGSVLQRDGQVRMSAALMSGTAQAISGVINVQRVQNPIKLALALQDQRDRILAADGAQELARALGVPLYDPITERRLQEWVRERAAHSPAEAAEVASQTSRTGTIGVVALDAAGRLAAGTSTGGRGFEHIGRVSDAATPAGNYATAHAAISCTGIGEDILDECFAARIAVRVEDGAPLLDALARSIQGASARQRKLAAIALDAGGRIGFCKTTDLLLSAWQADATRFGDTLELPPGDFFHVVEI
jgi:L-asparaginase